LCPTRWLGNSEQSVSVLLQAGSFEATGLRRSPDSTPAARRSGWRSLLVRVGAMIPIHRCTRVDWAPIRAARRDPGASGPHRFESIPRAVTESHEAPPSRQAATARLSSAGPVSRTRACGPLQLVPRGDAARALAGSLSSGPLEAANR